MVRRVFEMPRTVVLVSSGNIQQTEMMPASRLYHSAWFQKAADYATAISKQWFILSPAYGLTAPGTIIPPSPVSFKKMNAEERKAWLGAVILALTSVLQPGDRVVILAPEEIRTPLLKPIRRLGCGIEIPMEGLRFTEQLSWLDKEIGSS